MKLKRQFSPRPLLATPFRLCHFYRALVVPARPRNHYGPNREVLARPGRVRVGRRGHGRQEGLAGGRGLRARGVAQPAGRDVPVERRARGAGHRGGDGQTVGTGAEREGLRGRVLV